MKLDCSYNSIMLSKMQAIPSQFMAESANFESGWVSQGWLKPQNQWLQYNAQNQEKT